MSFPLVHFRSRLFLYKSGKKILDLKSNSIGGNNYSKPMNTVQMEVDYQFSNQSTPSTTSITIHNLNNQDAKKFKKGRIISIRAGWTNGDWTRDNVHHIFTSTISTVNPMIDSAGDWQLSISCQDGNKYSDETALSKIYKSKSKSIRSNSSDSKITASTRSSLKKIEEWMRSHNLSIRIGGKRGENTIREARRKLMSSRKAKNAAITASAKSQRAEIKREFADISAHGKRNTGTTNTNKHNSHERKIRNEAVTRWAKSKRSILRDGIAKAEAILRDKRTSLTSSNKRKRNHVRRIGNNRKRRIRTREASKKEKQRRARTKQKTKAKKTSSSGLHFKKNTRGKTIIKRLAKIGHIKISSLKLVKNHRFTSGYTATKTPWQEIQTVAKDYCNSNIWFPHGYLKIGNFAQHKRLPFTWTPTTGLTQTPTPDDDDSSEDDDDTSTQTMNAKQIKKQQKQNAIAHPTIYSATGIFLPFVTTGSTFHIKDPLSTLPSNVDGDESIKAGSLFDDEIVVESGELSFGQGDMPTSQLNVVTVSALAKQQKQSDSQKALKAKQESHKDAKKRKRIKVRRAKRARARKKR